MNSHDPWNPLVLDPAGEVIYPRPWWGHPLYQEVPSWPHAGDPDDTMRTLFDGAFVGADVPPFSARAEIDDKQILHAEVRIDGQRYEASLALAPVIAAVMQKLAQMHHQLHAADLPQQAAAISGDVAIGAVDRTIGCAADALIGSLVEQHYSISGWWHSLTHGVVAVVNKAGDTIKDLKVPITIAAAAAATAFLGPAAAPLAAQVAGAMADAAGGNYKGAGQAALQVADKAAASNPEVAQVVAVAKEEFAKAAAAHHVAATAHQASTGDPTAQKKITQIATAAKQGDPSAQQLIGAAQGVKGGFDLSSIQKALSSAKGS